MIRLSRESIGNKEAVQELRDEYPFDPLYFFFDTKTADLLFPEMKRAIEEESKDFYAFLVTFWTFADPTLMSDPRFMSVMKDYGAFEVWRKRGPPDRCKAVGESYACE